MGRGGLDSTPDYGKLDRTLCPLRDWLMYLDLKRRLRVPLVLILVAGGAGLLLVVAEAIDTWRTRIDIPHSTRSLGAPPLMADDRVA